MVSVQEEILSLHYAKTCWQNERKSAQFHLSSQKWADQTIIKLFISHGC